MTACQGAEGPRGYLGWGSDEHVVGKLAPVESVILEGGKQVHGKREVLLYVDRTNREVGIRTPDGGKVFVHLDDVLELLRKGVL